MTAGHDRTIFGGNFHNLNTPICPDGTTGRKSWPMLSIFPTTLSSTWPSATFAELMSVAFVNPASSSLASALLDPKQITALFLALAVMLGLARLLAELSRKLGQPSVLGEILAGVLLGPTVLGLINDSKIYDYLFPATGSTAIAEEGFITISAALLLLAAGLEVDLSTVWRQRKAAIMVSLGGIVLPFGAGAVLATFWPEWMGMGTSGSVLPFAIFVGIAMSITALPVIAKILIDLNISKSDIGMIIMASAMLNDMIGWIGFAVVLALMAGGAGMAVETAPLLEAAEHAAHIADAAHGGGSGGVMLTIGMTLVFLAVMLTLGRWAFHRVMPYIQAHWSYPGGVLGFVLVLGLLCAAFTESVGIHSIFGAFIAGVAIGDSHHLRQRTRDTIHNFITNIFAPVFFASIGLRINFVEAFDPMLVVVVLVVAATGKIGGSYFGASKAGMSKRESGAVSFGMAAQGAIGIILGQLGRDANLITDELMVAIVVMALATSLMSGPAMQKMLQQKQKRKLGDLLTERHFLPALSAHTVQETIRELATRAGELTEIPVESIYKAVWQREQIIHTGIGNGMAIPHARMDGLEKPTVVVGRCNHGVDFDAPDGKRARLIFMLLTPQDDPESQLELLEMVGYAFREAQSRDAALEAKSFTELLAAMRLVDESSSHGVEE